MLTSGSLAALQEALASWIAHDRTKHGHYVSARVPKMAVYGAFISAPLGHVLINILQKLFAGRTSLKAKILQILVSNLIVRGRPRAGPWLQMLTASFADFTHPKYRLPRLNGHHCGRSDLPPGQRHSEGWLLACHESQLGHLTTLLGFRTEVFARADLGALLQYHRFFHWDVHQRSYKEIEDGGFTEKGTSTGPMGAIYAWHPPFFFCFIWVLGYVIGTLQRSAVLAMSHC